MGLLDALFSSNSYGGQGGGLLDLIRNTQTQQNNYQPVPGAGRSFDNATFDPQTYAPNQAQPIGVGNYQMPRMGAAPLFAPPQQDQAALPPNAQPTQGQLPQAAPQQAETPLPPQFGGGGYLDRLNNGGGLISSLFGDSGQQQNLSAQFNAFKQALIANGETPQAAASKAMVAVSNPEAAKTIIPELFTNKQEFKVIKDALGGEHGYWVDKLNQTMKPADAGAGGAPGSPMGGGATVLAPGVKQYDPSLSGEAYMAQFSPEVQNAAKAYMNGDVQPTGNPRVKGIESLAKQVAQKYGSDMGIPVSDALFAEKRKYRTELGTNSPNSAGGQAKAFNQGISHLSALADNLEKLDNSNGLGIPAIASAVNSVRQGTSIQQSAIADEAKSIGQTVAGEVGKLFSGSAGGGVHERELTRERFDTAKSKPQLAAALRATIETMQGGLTALEQRRDAVLGPNSGVDLVDQSTRDKIAKIQGVIDRLEGKAPANSGLTKSALPSGWSVQVR